jgi:hypothetical protein
MKITIMHYVIMRIQIPQYLDSARKLGYDPVICITSNGDVGFGTNQSLTSLELRDPFRPAR